MMSMVCSAKKKCDNVTEKNENAWHNDDKAKDKDAHWIFYILEKNQDRIRVGRVKQDIKNDMKDVRKCQ